MQKPTVAGLIKSIIIAVIAGYIINWFLFGAVPFFPKFRYQTDPSTKNIMHFFDESGSSSASCTNMPVRSVCAFEQSAFCKTVGCTELSRSALPAGMELFYHTRYDRRGEYSVYITTGGVTEASPAAEVTSIKLVLQGQALQVVGDGTLLSLIQWAGADVTELILSDYIHQQLSQKSVNFPDDIQSKLDLGKVIVKAAIARIENEDQLLVVVDLLK